MQSTADGERGERRGLEIERDELKHWLSETSAAVEEEQKRSSSLEVRASYTAFEHS